MPFDQNLAKVTTIGIIFLLILGYLTYDNLTRTTSTNIVINDKGCDDCQLSLGSLKFKYSKEIDDLKRQIKDKEIDIRLIKERENGERQCQNLNDLKSDNEKFKSRLEELQKSQTTYHELTDQFQKCKKAYVTLTSRIQQVFE